MVLENKNIDDAAPNENDVTHVANEDDVLVKNVSPDAADESVSEAVEHFFLVNHLDNYLTHQVDPFIT
ncbi:hypothetical protein Tco_0605969 [Tanacetum coccineum]